MVSYGAMKVGQLKILSKSCSLPVSGLKSDLVGRLAQSDSTFAAQRCRWTNEFVSIAVATVKHRKFSIFAKANWNRRTSNPLGSTVTTTNLRNVIQSLQEIPGFTPTNIGRTVGEFQPFIPSQYILSRRQSQPSTSQNYGISASTQYMSNTQPPSFSPNYDWQGSSQPLTTSK
ncbi:hypothetical protein L207DRAFT_292076 [Hyaloscypha variabilis F]|uniref:SAP domain-containing protein n=1 Tax=Hyaloscypha variabilis (strain UAMH 11265 / GT02V1 / F) TaxID=1149755 RepID=A0A2J6RXK8_HYAVF|nr:hypothetical protein L207DRAFT_292076 [Hyaloscypha variabilis F]